MRANIKTTQFEMTSDVQAYVDEKLSMLDKYIDPHDPSILCEVEIGKVREGQQTGEIYRAEINIRMGKKLLRATAAAESMNAALDEAKDDIARQLNRGKNKRLDFIRRGGAKVKQWLRFGKS